MTPKLSIASSRPDASDIWVCRARNPFMLALVEQTGLVGVRLHCWPPEARSQTTEIKLAKCINRMADFYFDEVEELGGGIDSFDYVFDDAMTVPRWLVADNSASEWTGIIHTQSPRFIATVDDDGITVSQWIDDPSIDAPTMAKIISETGDWYAEFTQNELD